MKWTTRAAVWVGLFALAAAGAALLAVRLRSPRLEALVTSSGRALTPLCGAVVKAHCEKRVECGLMDRRQLEACIDDAGAECERSLGWKLRAGVLSTGGEPLQECLEGLGEASCSAVQRLVADDEQELFELTDRCEPGEMFQPHSGLGDPCAEDSDCTAGYCPGLAPECHRCRPYVREGERCEPGVLVCDPARARCVMGPGGVSRCAALAADGAACSGAQDCLSGACRPAATGRTCPPAPAGASCLDVHDCASGFYCRTKGGSGRCLPRAATGAPCDDEPFACAEQEAACVAGLCQVRQFRLREGEPCRDFSDCRPGLYCEGARRGPAGHCAPQAAAGQPCDRLDFGGCGPGATCAGDKCRPLRGPGESCAGPLLCKSFLSCVPDSLEAGFKGGAKCVPDATAGQSCNRFLACAASFCDDGKCVPLAGGGQPCRVSEQCESHWCVTSPAGGTCYAPCAPR